MWTSPGSFRSDLWGLRVLKSAKREMHTDVQFGCQQIKGDLLDHRVRHLREKRKRKGKGKGKGGQGHPNVQIAKKNGKIAERRCLWPTEARLAGNGRRITVNRRRLTTVLLI